MHLFFGGGAAAGRFGGPRCACAQIAVRIPDMQASKHVCMSNLGLCAAQHACSSHADCCAINRASHHGIMHQAVLYVYARLHTGKPNVCILAQECGHISAKNKGGLINTYSTHQIAAACRGVQTGPWPSPPGPASSPSPPGISDYSRCPQGPWAPQNVQRLLMRQLGLRGWSLGSTLCARPSYVRGLS